MSDLFKRHRPRLSEDEERALWERVRTIPREAAGHRPAGARRRAPWEALWARPAVRYGAPALAVALVAVLWVTERQPVPPAREEALGRSVPGEGRVAVETGPDDAPDAPAPTPRQDAAPPAPAAGSRAPAPAAPPSATSGTAALRPEARSEEGASGATRGGSTFAPPPAAETAPAPSLQKERVSAPAVEPQAVKDFYREDPRVGSIRAAGEAPRVAELRAARGDRTHVPSIGGRILVDVLGSGGAAPFVETVTLPVSGGVARIAVGDAAGTLWVEDGDVRDLVRVAGREAEGGEAGRRGAELDPAGGGPGAAALAAPDRRPLRARLVLADGGERVLAGPRSSPRSRAAGLAADLVLAVLRDDAAAVARVREFARRLAAERPNDAAARALAAWSDDARAAFEGP